MGKTNEYETPAPPRQELSETGEQIGIELDADEELIEPFDPSKITIEQKTVPMDTILRRLKQGTLILSPSFQRKEVWNASKKSRLIESIMLNIPLPMFYVAADDLGRWEVVDGLQRLSAIRDFLHGDKNGVLLKLKDLEFLSKRFDGKTFKVIENNSEDQKIVNTLLETEMRFTIIAWKTLNKSSAWLCSEQLNFLKATPSENPCRGMNENHRSTNPCLKSGATSLLKCLVPNLTS